MGGHRPIKTKCWEKYLEFRGCHYKSTSGSHHKWRCPGCFRSIIFRGAEKEIPFAHINTNLTTMGITKEEFLKWIKKNC